MISANKERYVVQQEETLVIKDDINLKTYFHNMLNNFYTPPSLLSFLARSDEGLAFWKIQASAELAYYLNGRSCSSLVRKGITLNMKF